MTATRQQNHNQEIFRRAAAEIASSDHRRRRLDSLHAQPFTRNHSKEFRKQMNAIREWLAPGRAAMPFAASEISGFASSRQSRPQKTNASMENA